MRASRVLDRRGNAMPEPTPDPAPAPTPPAPTPAPDASSQTVPLDRFNQVIAESRAAQRERDEATARIQALEDEKKSDTEKAIARAERAERERDEAKNTLAKTKRDGALRTAAATQGAISADAVVALAESRGLAVDPDKPETVVAALDAIKESDPALFNGEGTPAPTRQFGVPAPPAPGVQPQPNATDDPKLDLGRGLLSAINARRG